MTGLSSGPVACQLPWVPKFLTNAAPLSGGQILATCGQSPNEVPSAPLNAQRKHSARPDAVKAGCDYAGSLTASRSTFSMLGGELSKVAALAIKAAAI